MSKGLRSQLRQSFGALHHSYQKLGDVMFNKDSLIAQATLKKRDPAVFEMSNCPETSISGGTAIRPDVVLL